MYSLRTIILCCVTLGGGLHSITLAQSKIELKSVKGTYSGTPVYFNKQVCWLAAEDGSYSGVLFRDVTESRRISQQFHPLTAVQMRGKLQKELGNSFEVVTLGKFVVAAPSGRADEYARLLDRMSRHFSRYSSVRNLPIETPTFPLVTIIYPSQFELLKAAAKQGQNTGKTLMGYYHPQTNRIMLFEANSTENQDVNLRGRSEKQSQNKSDSISADTVSILIHEGIHQLAFNQGLHSRVGNTPRWIVEGLATMLEADSKITQSQTVTNINQDRLSRFKRYREERRRETIAEFIVNDEQYFRSNSLDAYSQAWALTYFLAEDYSAAYARYLKIVSERDPLAPVYLPEERLSDFQKAFGNDLSWLEVKFLRFVDRL